MIEQDLLTRIREILPDQIAKEICSIQPITVSIDDLYAAAEWLTQSRLNRGVHPITEESLKGI